MEELIKEQNYDEIIEEIIATPQLKLSKSYDIKTLVFDLGGVYFTAGTPIAIDKIKRMYSLQNKKLLKHLFSSNTDSIGSQIRLGLLTIDEFETKIRSKLRIPKYKNHHIWQLWFNSYIPNLKMPELIQSLSKSGKYRMVIFSGNVKERIEFLDKKYDFLKYFDDTIFSFDYQYNKRDIEFYYELLDHINCRPQQVLLIDDRSFVLNYAKSLKFNCIQYSSTEQLIKEFKKYGIEIAL
ncbi:MAG: HAD hydrolase-like protein [Promethearchaeota archaeon]